MKDKILKIAKVKSEKEFYKKYPTEEAFMKAHGKAFKKAAMGSKMVNDQLHQLTDWDSPKAQKGIQQPITYNQMKPLDTNIIPYNYDRMSLSAQQPAISSLQGKLSDPGFQKQAISNVEASAPAAAGFDAAGAGMAALGALPGIISGVEAIGAQKKAQKKAEQATQLSGLALQAQQTTPKAKRKYVRPEDALVQPGQLGNPYGTGTNYLAEDGVMIGGNPTEIQNMYNPGDMYTDLGFEPMGETLKQYKHGGDMHKAELGDYFQDSGQAQIGSAVGSAIGNAILPGVGGAIGGLLGKVGGNLLGGAADANRLAREKEKADMNTQQAAFTQVQQNQFGAYMENGGWVSNDWQPQTFTKFGDYSAKQLLAPPKDADMLRSGGHLAQVGYTAPSEEALFTGRPDMPHAQYGKWMKMSDPSKSVEVQSTLPPMQNPTLSDIKAYTQLNFTDTNVNGKSKYNKDFTSAQYTKDYYKDQPSQEVYSYSKDTGDKFSEFTRLAPEGGEATNELRRIEARRPFLNLLGKKQSMERFDKLDETKAQEYLQQMNSALPGGLPGYVPKAQLGIVTSPLNMVAAAGLDAVGRSRLKKMLKEAPMLLGAMDNGGRMTSTNMMFDTDRYPRAQDGVQLAMGGDLEVGDGGRLETLSYNPNLPGGEIGMFRGASHDNGGIKTKYGENEVEVEGNEPVVKLEDGGSAENLVVFGNIKINKNIADLMGDPKAKGKKFKTYIADVAKNDAKQLKRINKALDLIENSDENSAYDHLSLNTGSAMLKGATAWQKINAEKIKQAGLVQDAIHKTANELGAKSDKLAEGKIEKETDPSMMGQNGYNYKTGKGSGKALADAIVKDALKGVPKNESEFFQVPYPLGKGSAPAIPDVVVSGKRKSSVDPNWLEWPDLPGPFTKNEPVAAVADDKEGFDWKGLGKAALSYVAPWLRPSNANEPLNPDQLIPEYFALATNQVEPVQAQTFQPMLDTPYDISLNDQLNAIDSQSRAAIRASGQNTAAQANIMAQTLQAKNQVLAEQNRINQANKMGVYDRNRALLNDAQLKNLQILDQQYVRQAQARSNTKAQTQAALNSIAAKTAQQRAANRKLAVLENMYNFRFSPSGRAYNVNEPYQFNMSGNPFSTSAMQRGLAPDRAFTYDEQGQIVGTREIPKSERSGYPSLSEISGYLDSQKNGGKTSKKNARNSSIVKALKNL